MADKYFIRYGDGFGDYMTKDQIKEEIEVGTQDAAERAKINPLTDSEKEYLLDICCSPAKFMAVEPGKEVPVSNDEGTLKVSTRCNVFVDRTTALAIDQQILCMDSAELAHIDYSYKPIKPIIFDEICAMQHAQQNTIIPVYYGAMPNLGLYTHPDGPVQNWAELLPLGKIDEAREAQEAAIEHSVKDIVKVASAMYEAGADGINLDTTGASGDPDAMAGFLAVKEIRAKYPDFCIEVGMAVEFILGMHGGLEFEGTRLAGLYPHEQVKVAEAAGVSIFGPTVNTNSSKSFPWNLARVVTFTKACSEVATIPIHPNVGMGVGSMCLTDSVPLDAASRADKAIVEIGKADGL
jgi:dimethylamine--corrinoid protein Co-methyltransferase